jgi:hypothetical protein
MHWEKTSLINLVKQPKINCCFSWSKCTWLAYLCWRRVYLPNSWKLILWTNQLFIAHYISVLTIILQIFNLFYPNQLKLKFSKRINKYWFKVNIGMIWERCADNHRTQAFKYLGLCNNSKTLWHKNHLIFKDFLIFDLNDFDDWVKYDDKKVFIRQNIVYWLIYMSLIIGLWIYNSKLILNIFIKKAWNEDLKDKAFARANNNFVKISKVIKTCCISTLRG